jgi:hypothetical protein
MAANPSACAARAQNAEFVREGSFFQLQDQLPLCWPTPPGTPPSPKRSYRSDYVYLGCSDLQDRETWTGTPWVLTDFDLVLRLVDFSGLRPVLAQRLGWTSGRGWKPFDPISLFLLLGWQITNRWKRAQTLRNLADPRYEDYRNRFGFEQGAYPTEGGVRYFLTALGYHSDSGGDTIRVELDDEPAVEVAIQYLNQLLVGAVQLIRQAGLFSPEAWTQALMCPDGMLHDAASHLRCAAVQQSCYQATSRQTPRPCPAKEEKEQQGCDCDTLACAEACRYATPRDAEARFVYYSGSNQPRHSPNRPRDKSKMKQGRTEVLRLSQPAPAAGRPGPPLSRLPASGLSGRERTGGDSRHRPAPATRAFLPRSAPRRGRGRRRIWLRRLLAHHLPTEGQTGGRPPGS